MKQIRSEQGWDVKQIRKMSLVKIGRIMSSEASGAFERSATLDV